jgi:selenocysteine lyase/cysteine desulfurase
VNPLSIESILRDDALRRDEFPVTRERIFVAHAGDCPLPRRVADAIAQQALNASMNDQEAAFPVDLMRNTRELTARFLGCSAEEVAFVGPTSLGLSLIASGLKLRRNQHVLIYHDDYPSNVYPWMALADRGIEVRFLNIRELGRLRTRDVLGQVDENTGFVALASCHFLAGWRIDIDAIGRALRERNVLFCLDGIQTLGAFPTPLTHVDFMAADAHKWLLGPVGSGVLYVRKELQDKLPPTVLGWHNVRCPDYVAQDDLVFRSDAKRYEAGSQNLTGLAGLRAALLLLEELGVENIARELLRKRAWLVPALLDKGWNILQADAPPESASAILSLWHPETDLVKLHQELLQQNIVTSLRRDRSGRRYLRLSPHFYNTDEELHRVLERL